MRRIFQLSYVTDKGNEATFQVKMATSGQAAAIYRAVTEKHAFYCCETVRSDVTEQFIRDLKVIFKQNNLILLEEVYSLLLLWYHSSHVLSLCSYLLIVYEIAIIIDRIRKSDIVLFSL